MKRALSRRAFLGAGAGMMLSLPWLEAMMPRKAQAAEGPALRFLAIYLPCGIHMADWTPSTEGPNFTLPYILEPLADVKSDILVLSGLDNTAGEFSAPGDHGGSRPATPQTLHESRVSASTPRCCPFRRIAQKDRLLRPMARGAGGAYCASARTLSGWSCKS